MKITLLFLLLIAPCLAQSALYKIPPQAVIDVIDAPRPPVEFPSPDHKWLLITQDNDIRSIGELARPFLKFAGLRIDPRSNSQIQSRFFESPLLISLVDGVRRPVQLPAGSKLGVPLWSNDSRFVALPRYTDQGVELWIVNTQTGVVKDMTGPVVNATLIQGYRQIHRARSPLNLRWSPDNEHILLFRTVRDRGNPPEAALIPVGPTEMVTTNNFSKERNWEDLSKTSFDHDLFDYYCSAQLIDINVITGEQRHIGSPGIYIAAPEVSPDGKYLLMQRVKRPYAYWVRYREFSGSIEIWNRGGDVVKIVAELPSAEDITPGKKRRNLTNLTWQGHKPATLVWIEAGISEEKKSSNTDKNQLMRLVAPFIGNNEVIAGSRLGFDRLTWLEQEDVALVTEVTGKRQWKMSKTSLFNLAKPDQPSRMIFQYADGDRDAHPGSVVEQWTPKGERVAVQTGPWLYLAGDGGSPQGDNPFLDKFNIETNEKRRLFQSSEGCYETFISFVGTSRTRIVIAHETQGSPRGFRSIDLETQKPTILVDPPHPYPQLKGITKQLITYNREDGLPLSGMLYLPSSYRPGTRLPLVIWSYPTEYDDPKVAGQVRVAVNSFTSLRGGVLGDNGGEGGAASARLFATQGYAVLFMAEMPIVGKGKEQNETYIKQIIASSLAAIKKLEGMGIADPKRVGIAGHSYGGFSSANLLANSDLFAAGIARSGSHNRTLDPWGFHAESGTVWESPELFLSVSPFFQADKIKAPLLLIHGEEDDSQASKTFQSYRMFHALRGLGAVSKLILLPRENHAYSARESILHVSAEMIEWFDRYVKNKASG
jgi:dipeptidyl aminopeptidase/acylaminoacyl peptidase